MAHDELSALLILLRRHVRFDDPGHAPARVGKLGGIHDRGPINGEGDREGDALRSAFAGSPRFEGRGNRREGGGKRGGEESVLAVVVGGVRVGR